MQPQRAGYRNTEPFWSQVRISGVTAAPRMGAAAVEVVGRRGRAGTELGERPRGFQVSDGLEVIPGSPAAVVHQNTAEGKASPSQSAARCHGGRARDKEWEPIDSRWDEARRHRLPRGPVTRAAQRGRLDNAAGEGDDRSGGANQGRGERCR